MGCYVFVTYDVAQERLQLDVFSNATNDFLWNSNTATAAHKFCALQLSHSFNLHHQFSRKKKIAKDCCGSGSSGSFIEQKVCGETFNKYFYFSFFFVYLNMYDNLNYINQTIQVDIKSMANFMRWH